VTSGADPSAGRPADRHHLEELVAPALARALGVARELAADPAGPDVPPALRPLLRFRRPTGPAARAVLAALDDDAFRAVVAADADEAELGRSAWLYLVRPAGWDAELEAALDERVATAASRHAETAAAEALRLRRELDAERERRVDLERELEGLGRRLEAALADHEGSVAGLAAAEAAAERARAERQAAVRDLKAVESRLAARTAEVRELRRRLDEASGAGAPGGAPGNPWAEVDPVEVADRLAELAERARALDDAAGALRDLLGPAAEAAGGPDDPPAAAPRPRRRPLVVGRGLVEGTVAATEVLLGSDGLEVLVDGYNVTLRAWPDLDLAEQRRRLEQGVARLASRYPATFTLVFDGSGEGGRPARRAASAVRVRFTPVDREADDEILDAVDALDPAVSVLVVSDDRRVIDGAAARGANTVSGSVLLEMIRR